MARIDTYFKFMKEQDASDLHLSTGNQPMANWCAWIRRRWKMTT